MKFLHLVCKNSIKKYKQRRMNYTINFMTTIFLNLKQSNKNNKNKKNKITKIKNNNNGPQKKIKKKIYILILIY